MGNTSAAPGSGSAPSVHPHACGEYLIKFNRKTIPHGSSPRMWGILARLERDVAFGRFIPTHVGNTEECYGRVPASTVHPHACGEYYTQYDLNNLNTGSSPRMWGIRETALAGCLQSRFIPTHVGNTIIRLHWIWMATVHPHACGEYFLPKASFLKKFGSSPRMWGIRED